MDKWKQKLREFMYGRNGIDDLGRVSLYMGLILYIIGLGLNNLIVYWIAICLVFYGCFRTFSKNRDSRYKENTKFRNYLLLVKLNIQQRKTHRIYMCPRCGRLVRVPRHKGHIEITCPTCGHKMLKNT